MLKFGALAGAAVALTLASGSAFAAGETSVIHWWTSGGEAAALKVLVAQFEKNGGKWKDNPVADGQTARMVARTRVLGGDPPTSMQWQIGQNLMALADDGLLSDVQEIAGDWDKVLPAKIAEHVKYKGKYVAAPLAMNGRNWIWSNPAVYEKVGVKVPTTWAEFNAVADKVRAAGYIPLALGGQSWQELIVFETVVLEVGGLDFYKKLIALDDKALASADMVKVYQQLDKIKGYLDPGSPSRDWNITASLLTAGKAASFIHGDWAKGEFLAAGKVPGKDIACSIFPAGKGAYVFSVDAFAMTAVKDKDARANQLLLAKTVMDPDLQRRFAIVKGAIPTRTDVSMEGLDSCAQAAYAASSTGQLIEAGDLVTNPTGWGAVQDSVTAYMHGKKTPEEGVKALVQAVKATK